MQRENSDVNLFVQEPVGEDEARAEEENGNNDNVEPDRESPPPPQLAEQTHTEVRKSARDISLHIIVQANPQYRHMPQ